LRNFFRILWEDPTWHEFLAFAGLDLPTGKLPQWELTDMNILRLLYVPLMDSPTTPLHLSSPRRALRDEPALLLNRTSFPK
jgi:hypothetical protein